MMINRWNLGYRTRQSNNAWMRGALWPNWQHLRIVGCVCSSFPTARLDALKIDVQKLSFHRHLPSSNSRHLVSVFNQMSYDI